MTTGKDKAAPLLDELQSLKSVLSDDHDPIPVLKDVIDSPSQAPASQDQPAAPAGGDDDHSREIFIQRLIDDMLPDIEAQLRRRLLLLNSDVLRRWYQQSQQD